MLNLSTLRNRDEIGSFLNAHGLVGTAVEVGSLVCEFARTIISAWNGAALHLVDPWERQSPDIYKEAAVNDTDFISCYKSCETLAQEYTPRVHLHRALSVDASGLFANESLDLVYIDANHSYDAVSSDLEAWWLKVKSFGIFGGHDFRNDVTPPQHCEVKRAVSDFLLQHSLPMHYTSPCGSWWIVKP